VKLRGAISGFGEVAAQAHLPGWRMRPEVEIVAIHDPVAERRHLAIRLIRNVRVYDDLELMLTGERPDFVDIASPPALHAAAAKAALEAGANVLVEKPLCLRLEEMDELVALAARKSRILMCVHNWKYSPPYRKAGEIVASGSLGAIRYMDFTRMRTGPAGASGAGGRWRLDPSSGGGILVDHGWHVFYLMHWLIGQSPIAVSAHLANPGGHAEEVADIRVLFPGEAVAHCHLSWRSPVRRTRSLISGEDAVLEIEGDRLRLIDRAGKTTEFHEADAADDSYHSVWFGAMAAEFERAIKSGSAGENPAEARTALAALIAARKSDQGKITVEL
jgi:predicted dehydrogenase